MKNEAETCSSKDIENGYCFDCGASNIPEAKVPFPLPHKRGADNAGTK